MPPCIIGLCIPELETSHRTGSLTNPRIVGMEFIYHVKPNRTVHDRDVVMSAGELIEAQLFFPDQSLFNSISFLNQSLQPSAHVFNVRPLDYSLVIRQTI